MDEQTTIKIVTESIPIEYLWWSGVVVPIVIAFLGYKSRIKMIDKHKKDEK